MQVAHSIAENKLPTLEMPADTPRTFLNIHAQCVQLEPLSRPSFAAIRDMLANETYAPSFKSLALRRDKTKPSEVSKPPPPTTAPPTTAAAAPLLPKTALPGASTPLPANNVNATAAAYNGTQSPPAGTRQVSQAPSVMSPPAVR